MRSSRSICLLFRARLWLPIPDCRRATLGVSASSHRALPFRARFRLSDDQHPNSGPHFARKMGPVLANWEPHSASSHRAMAQASSRGWNVVEFVDAAAIGFVGPSRGRARRVARRTLEPILVQIDDVATLADV